MTKRKIDYWVIPPQADGEFVAGMEEVLETYAQPYDAKHPVICMDEQPIQLLRETRVPIPATREHPRRVDMKRHWNKPPHPPLQIEAQGLLQFHYAMQRKRFLHRCIQVWQAPRPSRAQIQALAHSTTSDRPVHTAVQLNDQTRQGQRL